MINDSEHNRQTVKHETAIELRILNNAMYRQTNNVLLKMETWSRKVESDDHVIELRILSYQTH